MQSLRLRPQPLFRLAAKFGGSCQAFAFVVFHGRSFTP
jgi:hypothetical protein